MHAASNGFDIIVVGAGIVGLATTLQIKRKHPQARVAVIEKENDVSLHQTGNNSGVFHSGIYYQPGSLKAKNCFEGYKLMLEFAQENNIPYELCGKIIVATSEVEVTRLLDLFERGKQNNLQNLQILSTEEIRKREPHVNGLKGIFVPQTGIIDYKTVANKMRDILISQDVKFFFKEQVNKISQDANQLITLSTKNGLVFHTDKLITCAGLGSDRIAKLSVPDLPIKIIPFRGEYFKIRPERTSLIKNLVYPVPDPEFPFLGVHFTRMIEGGVEAGPNAVLAFKREGYKKSDINLCDLFETLAWPGFQRVALRYWKTGMGEFYRSFFKGGFVKALQRLLPEIESADLVPGGAGVRAQASARDGGLIDDFYFVYVNNILHVCNAPSPAATASLAIGKTIMEKIGL